MRTYLLTAIFLLTAIPAEAATCEPSESAPEVASPCVGPAPCVYVDLALCDMCGTLWIYQESNGVSGLQRRDEIIDDTCDGQIAGDTIIF